MIPKNSISVDDHSGFTIREKIHFSNGKNGCKQIKKGKKKIEKKVCKTGRVLRIAKLMALAIRFKDLIQHGNIKDFADLAKLGYVSRARLTQIMNLNLLAPAIQEDILFLPKVREGHDPITEHEIRQISQELDWDEQKRMWNELTKK